MDPLLIIDSVASNNGAIHVGWVNPLENEKSSTAASHRPTRSSMTRLTQSQST